MSNPIDNIKKLKGRSWSEIRSRSKQAISAYSEQIGLSTTLPTDDELRKLLIKSEFSEGLITSESLIKKFYKIGKQSFFPSFFEREKTVEIFRESFGDEIVNGFTEKARDLSDGKFDLLGFRKLDFGDPIDWHYEPIADIQAPMKHWKLFDDLDSKEAGDRKIIWELNRHQHFFTLGTAYLNTKNERFAAAFVRHLKEWMDQNPPQMGINWSSSLEVGFRTISWLWAFHCFKGSISLTPGIFLQALKYLFVQGMHIERYLSTYYSPNTHLTGEALALYYLGTQLPFFSRAEHWRTLGEKILLEQLDEQILNDGVYFEQSTWYQRYTADFYLHFLILRKLNGGVNDADVEEKLEFKIQSLLDFLMYATRPDGSTPMIGDDDGGRSLPLTSAASDDFRGTLAVGAIVFNRGDYKYVAGKVSQEALWLFGADGAKRFDDVEAYYPEKNSKAFKDGGYFVMRDGWSGTDNYLLFDAGEVGSLNGGHGHADVLSFELAAAGKTMLVDPGTYTYHKSKDLRDSFRSSNAHNTFTIDHKSSSELGGKFSWKSKAIPNVKSWLSFDRFDFVEASHNGYDRLETLPIEHTRSILFLRNEYWIMRDFVNLRGEHHYQQNFHFDTGTNPTLASGQEGTSYVDESSQGDVGLRLFTFGDNGSWTRREGWVSDCYGKRENAPFLQFISKGKGPQEFFTIMIPQERGDAESQVFETEVEGGRAFVINYLDYQDLFVFSDGDQIVRTEMFDTDFRFLWARLSKGDELPEEFVLIDGNNFSLGGRVVFQNPTNLPSAIARRFGDKLHVRTDKDVFSVSLPTKKSNTVIVKRPVDE